MERTVASWLKENIFPRDFCNQLKQNMDATPPNSRAPPAAPHVPAPMPPQQHHQYPQAAPYGQGPPPQYQQQQQHQQQYPPYGSAPAPLPASSGPLPANAAAATSVGGPHGARSRAYQAAAGEFQPFQPATASPSASASGGGGHSQYYSGPPYGAPSYGGHVSASVAHLSAATSRDKRPLPAPNTVDAAAAAAAAEALAKRARQHSAATGAGASGAAAAASATATLPLPAERVSQFLKRPEVAADPVVRTADSSSYNHGHGHGHGYGPTNGGSGSVPPGAGAGDGSGAIKLENVGHYSITGVKSEHSHFIGGQYVPAHASDVNCSTSGGEYDTVHGHLGAAHGHFPMGDGPHGGHFDGGARGDAMGEAMGPMDGGGAGESYGIDDFENDAAAHNAGAAKGTRKQPFRSAAAAASAAVSTTGLLARRLPTIAVLPVLPPAVVTLSRLPPNARSYARDSLARATAAAGTSSALAGANRDIVEVADFSRLCLRRTDASAAAAVADLYENMPYPCDTCGWRFHDNAALQKHLDEHFRDNQRRRAAVSGRESRQYYWGESTWVTSTSLRDTLAEVEKAVTEGRDAGSVLRVRAAGRSKAGRGAANAAQSAAAGTGAGESGVDGLADAVLEEKDDGEVIVDGKRVVLAVAEQWEASPPSCAVCKDSFVKKWDDDDDSWVFLGAVPLDLAALQKAQPATAETFRGKDGVPVHWKCWRHVMVAKTAVFSGAK